MRVCRNILKNRVGFALLVTEVVSTAKMAVKKKNKPKKFFIVVF